MATINWIGEHGIYTDTEQGLEAIAEHGIKKEQPSAAPPSGRIMSSLAGPGGLAGHGGIAGRGGGLAG